MNVCACEFWCAYGYRHGYKICIKFYHHVRHDKIFYIIYILGCRCHWSNCLCWSVHCAVFIWWDTPKRTLYCTLNALFETVVSYKCYARRNRRKSFHRFSTILHPIESVFVVWENLRYINSFIHMLHAGEQTN